MQKRVAFIGAGFVERALVPAFRKFPELNLVALSSRNQDKARSVAEKVGISQVFGDWRKMLQETQPQIVVLAVPAKAQYEILKEIFGKGYLLFCEKPLAVNYAQAEELIGLWKKTQEPCTVDFEFPESDCMLKVRELIPTLGKLKSVRVKWHIQTFSNQNRLDEWQSRISEGGGALAQFGSHVLYNLETLGGTLDSFRSEIGKTPGDPRDTDSWFRIEGKYKSGASVFADIDTDKAGVQLHHWEIEGEKGRLVFENLKRDYVGGFKILEPQGVYEPKEIPGEDGRAVAISRIIQNLLDARPGNTKTPNIESAFRVQYLMELIRTGKGLG